MYQVLEQRHSGGKYVPIPGQNLFYSFFDAARAAFLMRENNWYVRYRVDDPYRQMLCEFTVNYGEKHSVQNSHVENEVGHEPSSQCVAY